MITSAQLRYLRTANKYVGGGLAKNFTDKSTIHMVRAIFGVLSRVIVDAEDNPERLRQLRAAAEVWRRTLSKIISGSGPERDLAEQLDRLLESERLNDPAEIEELLSRLVMHLSQSSDKSAQRLVAEMVEEEWLHASKIEDDYATLTSDLATQSGEGEEAGLSAEQQKKLAQILRQQCGEPEELEVVAVQINPGGYSKQTLFVDLEHNTVLPDRIVLRKDRKESPLDSKVVDEFPLLQILYEHGIRVPRPFALDVAGEVAGDPLLAVSSVPGTIIGDGIYLFEKQGRAGCALSLAREMAKYHAIPVAQLPESLPGKYASNREIMREDLDKLLSKWRECGTASILVEAAFGWLYDHLDDAGEQRALTHGDMRLHNALVEGEEVAAILDWELAAVGNPGFDIAYAYHHVTQLVSWQAFLDAYVEAGGVLPPKETIDFYLVRTELFILINMSKMEAGFLAGDYDDIGLAYASINFTQYASYLLADRLRQVMNAPPNEV